MPESEAHDVVAAVVGGLGGCGAGVGAVIAGAATGTSGAAAITSGLAATGALIGGSMMAGVVVVAAAPIGGAILWCALQRFLRSRPTWAEVRASRAAAAKLEKP